MFLLKRTKCHCLASVFVRDNALFFPCLLVANNAVTLLVVLLVLLSLYSHQKKKAKGWMHLSFGQWFVTVSFTYCLPDRYPKFSGPPWSMWQQQTMQLSFQFLNIHGRYIKKKLKTTTLHKLAFHSKQNDLLSICQNVNAALRLYGRWPVLHCHKCKSPERVWSAVCSANCPKMYFILETNRMYYLLGCTACWDVLLVSTQFFPKPWPYLNCYLRTKI